jgi:hypothetical protein
VCVVNEEVVMVMNEADGVGGWGRHRNTTPGKCGSEWQTILWQLKRGRLRRTSYIIHIALAVIEDIN